ncbi:hypothetical protein [Legionella jamestowniensis]|uniref:Dot/Icm T4SS effector n=1 Tax=Legionella jamestowniensis TaxID=455 RepID=A0A0W0ULM6_9GAMM|nr:hypothetical protein [Legionella jamestowniensis]KTD08615.1 Dot/Icm T4SS effector [Legionella jamestowniensis]OCH96937.1 hypothetical protein A8135_04665 [Legionella jamestowniensis]SFL53626.1 Substrate of the Dot/Icm secretion system, putative [Legionella jamestowniensis DSM 19215]
MGFTLTSYNDLKSQLAVEIIALRGKHSAESIDKLPDHRRIQVEVLNAAIAQLDHMPAKSNERENNQQEIEKARILSGLIWITINEISENSGSGSLFRKSLGKVMGIRDEDIAKNIKANHVDPNSAARMINAAMKFFSTNIFEHGDSTRAMLENNPFSAVKGFDILAFAKRGIAMEAAARTQVFVDADLALKKVIHERELANKGPSVFTKAARYLTWNNTTSAEDEDEEEDLKDNIQATV